MILVKAQKGAKLGKGSCLKSVVVAVFFQTRMGFPWLSMMSPAVNPASVASTLLKVWMSTSVVVLSIRPANNETNSFFAF